MLTSYSWITSNKILFLGELIPGSLALAMVKAEMGQYPDAKAFLVEGFPRELNQLKEFEKEVNFLTPVILCKFSHRLHKLSSTCFFLDKRLAQRSLNFVHIVTVSDTA